MKTVIDWLIIFCFFLLMLLWVVFEIPASLLMCLLNKLEKRIDSFIY